MKYSGAVQADAMLLVVPTPLFSHFVKIGILIALPSEGVALKTVEANLGSSSFFYVSYSLLQQLVKLP